MKHLLLLILVTTGVLGCGAAVHSGTVNSGDAVEEHSGETPAEPTGASVDTPTYRSDPWPAGVVAEMIGAANPQRSVDYRNSSVLVCMERHHLRYLPEIEGPTFFADRLDHAGVEIYGFGLGIQEPDQVVNESPNNAITEELGAEERTIWHAQLERCVDDATRAEEALLESAFEDLPAGLQQEVLGIRSFDHRLLGDAVAAWSRCMMEAGYDYQHPLIMIEDLADLYRSGIESTESLQAKERAMATSNYSCRYDILSPAFTTALADIEQRAQRVLGQTSTYTVEPS